MRVTVWSDLHTEHNAPTGVFRKVEKADVLLIAGDLLKVSDLLAGDGWCIHQMRDLARNVFPRFGKVVIVLGNHDFAGGAIDEAHGILSDWLLEEGCTNVHVLENEWVDLGAALVFGCTLWTELRDRATRAWVGKNMPEYANVVMPRKFGRGRLTAEHTSGLHTVSCRLLRRFLKVRTDDPVLAAKPVVVLTHHAPSLRSLNLRVLDNGLDPAFASDLEGFIKEYPEIAVWVHGHTHTNVDYRIGETRVFANQVGYAGERRDRFDVNRGFVLPF